MKILNIDSYVAPKRQLAFKGKNHDVLPLNVQQFIDNLAAAEKLEKEQGDGAKFALSEQVKESVAAISQAIPTLQREEILNLPIEAMTAVLEFIRGDLDPPASAAVEGQDAQPEEGADAKKPD
jgi:hypothetical protein